ncbi:hypothetical protein MNBD_GAMMA12-3740 [hydrothermal vent metagenome]|uniref:NlpC/P60 domain-containing protein n=1 Tax=hydrothermal vent metagenome TaxID=652676 RepID=A0A3B0YAT2_9ZZZZ
MNNHMNKPLKVTYITLLALLISACGSAQLRVPEISELEGSPAGIEIVKSALNQLGRPYLYGGNTPKGFDCSGLIEYSHSRIGVYTPRNTYNQFRESSPVKLSALRAGDLIFFRISRNKVNHVGIYMGRGFFIHSPSTGKKVSIKNLASPYWQKRVLGAGRYYKI